MKKEINELLSSKNAKLRINEGFYLKHTVLDPKTDFLGRTDDRLEIYMDLGLPLPERAYAEIVSRDYEGIVSEIYSSIEKMMDDYKAEMLRKFKGGKLDGRKN